MGTVVEKTTDSQRKFSRRNFNQRGSLNQENIASDLICVEVSIQVNIASEAVGNFPTPMVTGWVTRMTHRKPLEKIPGLCSKGGIKVIKLEFWVFSSVSIIIHRGVSGYTSTNIGDGDRSTDNNFASYDIGPQPLDEDRPIGNKLTDCDTRQSVTNVRHHVRTFSYFKERINILNVRHRFLLILRRILSVDHYQIPTPLKYRVITS